MEHTSQFHALVVCLFLFTLFKLHASRILKFKKKSRWSHKSIFTARSLKTKVNNVNNHKQPKLIILSFEVPKVATECVCASWVINCDKDQESKQRLRPKEFPFKAHRDRSSTRTSKESKNSTHRHTHTHTHTHKTQGCNASLKLNIVCLPEVEYNTPTARYILHCNFLSSSVLIQKCSWVYENNFFKWDCRFLDDDIA